MFRAASKDQFFFLCNAKRGACRLPGFAIFALSTAKLALNCASFAGRRAPHARCDQLVFRSKPGGVIPPLSVASELTSRIYARAKRNAREIAAQKYRWLSRR